MSTNTDDTDENPEWQPPDIHMAETRERPSGPFFLTNQDVATVERSLGSQCFGPGWASSTVFRGENLNLVRSSYESVGSYPHLSWWRVHVRGWVADDGGVYLRGHFEPDPDAHPDAHEDGVGYDVSNGMATLRDALISESVPIRSHITQLDEL